MTTTFDERNEDELARKTAQEVWAAQDFLSRCGIPLRDIVPLIVPKPRADGTPDPDSKLRVVILNVNTPGSRPFNLVVADLYARESTYNKQYAIWIKSARMSPDDTARDRSNRERVLRGVFEASEIWRTRHLVITFLHAHGVKVAAEMVHT